MGAEATAAGGAATIVTPAAGAATIVTPAAGAATTVAAAPVAGAATTVAAAPVAGTAASGGTYVTHGSSLASVGAKALKAFLTSPVTAGLTIGITTGYALEFSTQCANGKRVINDPSDSEHFFDQLNGTYIYNMIYGSRSIWNSDKCYLVPGQSLMFQYNYKGKLLNLFALTFNRKNASVSSDYFTRNAYDLTYINFMNGSSYSVTSLERNSYKSLIYGVDESGGKFTNPVITIDPYVINGSTWISGDDKIRFIAYTLTYDRNNLESQLDKALANLNSITPVPNNKPVTNAQVVSLPKGASVSTYLKYFNAVLIGGIAIDTK